MGNGGDSFAEEPSMRVKYGKEEYDVVSDFADLFVLSNGHVVQHRDCKILEDKPKAEPKPKSKKKADKVG